MHHPKLNHAARRLSVVMRLLAWLAPAIFLVGCAGSEPTPHSSVTVPQPGPGVFFVANNGNDQWSGTLRSPNWRGTDGPFLTVPRALEAARAFKRQGESGLARTVTVVIRRGSYFLNVPLVLRPEDSDLVITAYPGETPILSGGRLIAGWKQVVVNDRKLWMAEVPDVREGKWDFRELWVNGRRATRARHPNHGYMGIAELPDHVKDWTQGHSRFRFVAGDFKAPPGVTNAEVVVMTRWVESRLPILAVDENERIISFGKRSVFELAPGDLFYAEGAFEFLDAPGEWFLDRAARRLYYWPRPGERLGKCETVAPLLSQVIRLEGHPEKGEFVKRVTFRGITFSHTEWYFPAGFAAGRNKPEISPEPQLEVGGFAQAAIGVPGAVWGEGVRQCVFDSCGFGRLGNYGLELASGCASNRVSQCEFFDLGAGGLKIGETRIRSAVDEQSRENEISRCHIHDGGKLFASAIGIWIGQSSGNRIEHNLIHDFYYTGISIGWTWGYGPALASNNAVEFNHVHHIGVKSDGDGPVLSDMGGIYTLGKQPGTTVRNNLWHDIAGIRYGGWGIYFDEGSSGILAESNVVYRTTHGGFHQHYGETNIVRNNLFAFGRDGQVQRTRPEPHRSFTFETNIVYFDSGTLLTGDWSGNNYQMDRNLYFDARVGARSEQMRFAGATLGQWRERGHDRDSMIIDPLFVAPQRNDFEIKLDSPARKIGFQPISLSNVGP
jgi:hypothetical protein